MHAELCVCQLSDHFTRYALMGDIPDLSVAHPDRDQQDWQLAGYA